MQKERLLAKKSRRTWQGFSLVELLLTITILGIMAVIAIGAFGSARQGAEDQKDKRNAQQIASVAAIANAAGASFVVPGDEKATIENLKNGTSPSRGAFKGRLFKLSGLAEPEVTGAMRFLALNDTELEYHLDGS